MDLLNSRLSPSGGWSTELSPFQLAVFLKVYAQQKQPQWSADPMRGGYDNAGYWLKHGRFPASGHLSDEFKQPWHRSFSNQSRYALPTAPEWQQVGISGPSADAFGLDTSGWRRVDNQGRTLQYEVPTPLDSLRGMR